MQPLTKWVARTIGAERAIALDQELMRTPGYALEQLMELAGLAVAAATLDAYPPHSSPRVLCVCGPGNNGGDGLVAARHLHAFGFSPSVVYPKRPPRQHFVNLVAQCELVGVPLLDAVPATETLRELHDVILDAVFGFSFNGDVRPPFGDALAAMRSSRLPIVSVDIPSGWDVDEGPPAENALQPDCLISLTAPKPSSAFFSGRHYLGGRFVPAPIAAKFGIDIPPYAAAEQVVLLRS